MWDGVLCPDEIPRVGWIGDEPKYRPKKRCPMDPDELEQVWRAEATTAQAWGLGREIAGRKLLASRATAQAGDQGCTERSARLDCRAVVAPRRTTLGLYPARSC